MASSDEVADVEDKGPYTWSLGLGSVCKCEMTGCSVECRKAHNLKGSSVALAMKLEANGDELSPV